MTATIRTLALLGLCSLSSACSEATPAKKMAEPAQKVEPAPRPIAQPALAAHTQDLSATAQDRPASIADMPLAAHQPEPEAQANKATEIKPDENAPNEKEAIDLDREPDPAEVQIDRFVLATGVAAREPVGETDTFAADTKEIYAFVQFANPNNAPYALRVHWEKIDGPATPYGFKFEVPAAPRWRTWSWTRIRREPGQYRAVLRTLKGVEVASRAFEIVPELK